MNILKIQVLDTLFFRDGKPFSMGDETAIETKTIPFPTVFWGAIFSRLIADGKIEKINGKFDKKLLKIGRVFLYNEQNHIFLLPAPADIFKDKNGNIYTEKYTKKADIYTSNNVFTDFLVMPNTKNDVKRVENSFIEISSFKPYLEQFDNDISIYEIKEILEYEPKIGIKRNNTTNTTEEGNLYRIPMLRFKENWNYLVEYELDNEIHLEENGILKLGGEGKTVQFSKFNKKNLDLSENKIIEKDEFFKIYASSHLIFNEEITNWKNLFEENFPDCILWSVSNSTPVSVGGWDLENKKPKIMKKALPAGTVFMLKNKEKNTDTNSIKTIFSNLLKTEETRFGFNQFEILI